MRVLIRRPDSDRHDECGMKRPCYSPHAPTNHSEISAVIAKDLRSGVEQLGNMTAEAACIVPFTGAGISTECGIPDFRSPGGLWTKNRPTPFDEFIASQKARNESSRRRFAMEDKFPAARTGR